MKTSYWKKRTRMTKNCSKNQEGSQSSFSAMMLAQTELSALREQALREQGAHYRKMTIVLARYVTMTKKMTMMMHHYHLMKMRVLAYSALLR
jgi:hypothetical protein